MILKIPGSRNVKVSQQRQAAQGGLTWYFLLKSSAWISLPGKLPSQAGFHLQPWAPLYGAITVQCCRLLIAVSPLLWVLEHRVLESGFCVPAAQP